MKHGSLESGLGGFDYAAEMIGWENIFHCEINSFCRTILNYYWPNAKSYTDIFEFDGLPYRGQIDVLTAGFPCQPFSHAGKRKGSTDNRHIWPENLRVIKEIQPPFVIAENVPGLLTIERGVVFETVCADLENEGYEVTPFIIPACAKGAVHRRDRIWIVAHNSMLRCQYGRFEGKRMERTKQTRIEDRKCISHVTNNTGGRLEGAQQGNIKVCRKAQIKRSFQANSIEGYDSNVAYVDSERPGRSCPSCESKRKTTSRGRHDNSNREIWIEAATRLCCVDDESTGRLDTQAVSKSKWRTESLKPMETQ